MYGLIRALTRQTSPCFVSDDGTDRKETDQRNNIFTQWQRNNINIY